MSGREHEWAEVLPFIITLSAIAFAIGYAVGVQGVRDEAIREGSAMESVDPISGEMRFEWK